MAGRPRGQVLKREMLLRTRVSDLRVKALNDKGGVAATLYALLESGAGEREYGGSGLHYYQSFSRPHPLFSPTILRGPDSRRGSLSLS